MKSLLSLTICLKLKRLLIELNLHDLFYSYKLFKLKQEMKKQLIGFCFAFVLLSVNAWAQKTEIKQQVPLSQELQSRLCRFHEIETENTQCTNVLAAKKELLPTLKIDSVIWRAKDSNPAKNEYLFDSHGNRILILGSHWSYNTWINSTKDESVYDSNNNLLSTISYYRNGVGNTWTWDYFEKYEYTYDNDNHKILDIASVWDKPTNTWIVKFRYEIAYDTNGNNISTIFYKWAENTKDLTLSSKTEYIYNSQGLKSAKIVYSWNKNTNLWERGGKYEYGYDARGNQNSIVLSLGATDETSIGISKDESSFDSSNNNTSNIQYAWDTEAKKWLEVYKDEASYNSNNLPVGDVSYHWDKSAKVWITTEETQYIFDANGNSTSKITRSWDVLTNTWKNDSKIDYTYDNEHTIANLYPTNLAFSSLFDLFLFKNKDNKVPMEVTKYKWNSQNQQWESSCSSSESRYYSSISLTSVTETAENDVKFYPNPVVDMLRISNAEAELHVKLYNLQGTLLLQTNQNTLDFSPYKASVYFLNVNGQLKKIVKK